MPRRSLGVLVGLSGVSLGAVAVAGVDTRPLVLLTTGCFALVYVLGTAAALRLLPRGTRAHRSAVVAFVAVLVLLLMTGWYLVGAALVAAAALAYHRHRSRRAHRDQGVPEVALTTSGTP